MSDRLTLYWQPGCTSCLRAREFLAARQLEFESVNVREEADAAGRLHALGARSVPVIARGSDWTFAQDLDDVARFLGETDVRYRLPAAELVDRTQRLLELSRDYARAFPAHRLQDNWPGRKRTVTDLVFHIQMIAIGFLDAAKGGQLTEMHFERKPAPGEDTVPRLIEVSCYVSEELAEWWRNTGPDEPANRVKTYYGEHEIGPVLERTAWHVAQHVRQLHALLTVKGATADAPDPALLDGLPLPDAVWDDE